MNSRLKTIFIHILGWVVFLSIPVYLFSVLMVFKSWNVYELFRLVFTCGVLISLFYFSYCVLIPRYLFSVKFYIYSAMLFFVYIILSGLPLMLFEFVLKLDIYEPEALEYFDLVLIIMMYLLSFVVSFALRMNARWQYTEKERMSAQLSYLKTQINPHFLFNTLNGIYAVAIDKAPLAADMIEKLSAMMRYTLHDTKSDFVPLEKEISYIDDYIVLQKVRFDESVKLSYICEGNFEQSQIAPLLLIPFIENAFKHGVNSEQDSDISIKLVCNNDELALQVKNNKVNVERSKLEASGLGIDNTKNRLNLLYPNKHLLSITENKDTFNVSLHIILN
jgi:LytS/YehU family sensor histidine kinase